MYCTECGKFLIKGNSFCTSCGTPVSRNNLSYKHQFCTQCRNPIIKGNNFCTKCGFPVSVSRRKSSVSRRKSSVSRRKSRISRRKSSVSRRKSSVSRRKSSVSRRKSSVSRRKSSVSRRKSSLFYNPVTKFLNPPYCSKDDVHNLLEYFWRLNYYNKHNNLKNGDYFIETGEFNKHSSNEFCNYRLYYWNNNLFYYINLCRREIDSNNISLEIKLNKRIPIEHLKSKKKRLQMNNLFTDPELNLLELSTYKHQKQPIGSGKCGFYTVMNLLRIKLPKNTMDSMSSQIIYDYIKKSMEYNNTLSLKEAKKRAMDFKPGGFHKGKFYDIEVIKRTLSLFKFETHMIKKQHIEKYIEAIIDINITDTSVKSELNELNMIKEKKLSNNDQWDPLLPKPPSWSSNWDNYYDSISDYKQKNFIKAYIDNAFGIILNIGNGRHWYCITKRYSNYYIMNSSLKNEKELNLNDFYIYINNVKEHGCSFFIVNKLQSKEEDEWV